MEVALVTLHGMGENRREYAHDLHEALHRRLPNDWGKVHLESVFYQDLFEAPEESYLERMHRYFNADIWKGTIWSGLRHFTIAACSEGVALDYRADAPDSLYEKVQVRIREALERCWQAFGAKPKPVVILAQSNGGLILSNYLWDAQQSPARRGIWRQASEGGGEQQNFFRLKSLRSLFTTGCNIPMFVSHLPSPTPFAQPNPNFEWLNFFDLDDPVGWPLRPLGATYEELVEDREINAKGATLQDLALSATPMSHTLYWKTPEFLQEVEKSLVALLNPLP